MVEIKYSIKPDKVQNALKGLKEFTLLIKIYMRLKKILIDFTGEPEMVGNLSVGDQIRETLIRFRNFIDYESYINAIDQDYESEDAIFNGYIYKVNTPLLNLVKRSQYGNCCVFKHEIIDYRGHNCFIPTKRYCFVKCIKYLTGGEYKEQNLDFIRNEKRRSNIMTKA